MRMGLGDLIWDPRLKNGERPGVVMDVSGQPACLLRTVTVTWLDTGEVEELEETAWGPLED
jgi:hypothetical protein